MRPWLDVDPRSGEVILRRPQLVLRRLRRFARLDRLRVYGPAVTFINRPLPESSFQREVRRVSPWRWE